ncbi:MAG: diguanylate cyclase [Marinobacter sp.]|uniref:sensor domain-containing diguanylate cyclase n=1 Tax=Marinobacter sp. TaxID=50741 RepID=UPI00299E6B24|nr:diguanylate cyclase [Marinobacter sp.]MDX1755255.1 diguanylate cyclase [Marinobacter sp.]
MCPFALRFVLAIFSMLSAAEAAAYSSGLALEDGWEYRWGDSPFSASGRPAWVDQPSKAWQAIGFPSNPPNRNGRTNAWFRTTLPEGDWRDPVLYIHSVDLIVEVYFRGERIYHYGTFDSEGQGRFEGWPWHAIDLPDDFAGKRLYFRVYSNYSDIGLWGEVKIFDRSELLLYILDRSLDALVISGFCLLIAILALVFALVQSGRRNFASIALFSLAAAVMLIAESQASLLIWNRPLFWDYLAAGSYYLLPVAIGLLMAQWLADTRPLVINLIWRVHLMYVAGALTLALLGVVGLSSTFPVFDGLFAVTTVVLLAVVIRRYRVVTWEQRAMIGCYAVMGALLMVDMAVAHGFLPWGQVPVSGGALLFAVAIVVISLRHYAQTQRALKLLNRSLEHKVAERTASLATLARHEQSRAHQLQCENERTVLLNNLITELQDRDNLQTAVSQFARRLPELCRPLGGRFYYRLQEESAFQMLCHWGGGERSAIETLVLPDGDLPPPSRVRESDPDAPGAKAVGAVPALPWVLHVPLRRREQEAFVAGLLFLQPREGSPAIPGNDSQTTLFLNLDHAIRNVGITLSTVGLREELEKYSYEDALTGLKNRRFFDEFLKHEIAAARRHHTPLSVMVIDIDLFKRFNDVYGHPAGDTALRAVARVLVEQTRESDVVCRFGGEEFVVVLPGAGEPPALDRAELLRRSVAQAVIEYEGQTLEQVTVSIGVASWPETTEAADQLLATADEALYKAKQRGRNCVAAA